MHDHWVEEDLRPSLQTTAIGEQEGAGSLRGRLGRSRKGTPTLLSPGTHKQVSHGRSRVERRRESGLLVFLGDRVGRDGGKDERRGGRDD